MAMEYNKVAAANTPAGQIEGALALLSADKLDDVIADLEDKLDRFKAVRKALHGKRAQDNGRAPKSGAAARSTPAADKVAKAIKAAGQPLPVEAIVSATGLSRNVCGVVLAKSSRFELVDETARLWGVVKS